MIGTGIFTTSGFILAELSSPYTMLLSWVVGGLFALCGALCYGELGALFPQAGGEYVFLREGLGKVMGFMSGWISLIVGFSAPIAAASIAFATYFFQALALPCPKINLTIGTIEVLHLSPIHLTAVGIIIVLSLIHFHSLLLGSRVQNGLTIFKILFLIVFIISGLWLGQGSMAHFETPFELRSLFQDSFAVSLIFVAFAYSGWNAAAYLGSEIKNPGHNIPLALISGTIIVLSLYLLLNLVYIYALPPQAMSGVLEVGTKAASALFGHNISHYFSLAISLGLLSVLSAMIMSGPRIYYAMAKDKVFFQFFSQVNSHKHTPAHSIFLQAGIAIGMVLTTSFNSLLLYIGFTLSLFAMLTVIGLFRIRRQTAHLNLPYRTFGYPLTPAIFIIGNAWIIYFSIQSRPWASLTGLATMAAGLLVYLIFRQRGSGPKRQSQQSAENITSLS
jgi:APA family basic amino acid/polyamine antiporter